MASFYNTFAYISCRNIFYFLFFTYIFYCISTEIFIHLLINNIFLKSFKIISWKKGSRNECWKFAIYLGVLIRRFARCIARNERFPFRTCPCEYVKAAITRAICVLCRCARESCERACTSTDTSPSFFFFFFFRYERTRKHATREQTIHFYETRLSLDNFSFFFLLTCVNDDTRARV